MSDRYAHLTENQRRAITARGRSILVSAAAGSGKTTVLAERCASLVCDGPRDQRCGIDELLVVTFTDAAAGEMKSRIGAAIRKRIEESARAGQRDHWLAQQLYLLDGASISTIHSFCRTVIQRWFPQAGLDPQATVLAGPEAQLLREETLDALLSDLYASSDELAVAFQRLVDDYAAGNDYTLAQTVLRLHDYISTLPDPSAWLRECLARVDCDAPQALIHDLDRIQHERLATELRLQIEFAREAAATIRRCWPVAEMHAGALDGHAARLEDWLDALTQRSPGAWEKVAEAICASELKWTMRRPGGLSEDVVAAYEAAKAVRDRVREIYRRRVEQGCANFTAQEYREGLQRVAPYTRTLVELVERFEERYRAAKDAQAAVDFNDLQRYTLRVLADEHGRPTQAARHLQQQYRHVLVDEFQDVDPLQAAILHLVSRESADPPEGNLFTVGDIKQSIYRFRLAEPMLFTQRADRFAARADGEQRKGGKSRNGDSSDGAGAAIGELIHLRENFRSRASVIEAINLVFRPLMSRQFGGSDYDQDAELVAGATYPQPADAPAFDRPAMELHLLEPVTQQTAVANNEDDTGQPGEDESAGDELEGIEREAYLIGTRIREWMGLTRGSRRWTVSGRPQTPGGPPQPRPIDYRDIVILLRSVQHKAVPIADILRRMGIPARVDRDEGGLEGTEFSDVISLLEVLDNAQQDLPLAAVLRSPILGTPLNETQLLEVRLLDRAVPFHEAVVRYATEGGDPELRERIGQILATLERYRTRIRQAPVAQVLWEIYHETGYLAYVCGLPDGLRRRQNLIRLHDLAREFGQFSRQGLRRFLRFIDDARERESLSLGPTTAGPEENVVRIMTIHASKGLEFPVVVLADLQKAFNLSDTRSTVLIDRRYGLALRAADPERRILYPTLIHQLAAEEGTHESLSEELRVLYVALTRAREHLLLVGRLRLEKLEAHRALHAAGECPRRIPPLQLQTAQCMLDWLLPAIAAMPREAVSWPGEPAPHRPPLVQVHAYDRATTDRWSVPTPAPGERAGALAALARLEPLPPDEPVDAAANVDAILAGLHHHYRGLELTTVPSRKSVSELKRRWDPSRDDFERDDGVTAGTGGASAVPTTGLSRTRYAEPRIFISRGVPELPEGRESSSGAAAPHEPGDGDGAARGTATHRFLQLLDFSGSCDLTDLQAQRDALIAAGRLTPAEAQLVVLEDCAWFLQTDLGRRLRAPGVRLRREMPFVARRAVSELDATLTPRDARDVILIRGVIDLLIDTGTHLEILDYKTDTVARPAGTASSGADPDGASCEERIALYRPQIDTYARAVEAIYRRPVTGRWLVFLHGRRIVDCSASTA